MVKRILPGMLLAVSLSAQLRGLVAPHDLHKVYISLSRALHRIGTEIVLVGHFMAEWCSRSSP